MNEQQIRKIVDDQIQKKLFTLPKLPPHKHNGSDNIHISESDLKLNLGTGGTITFAHTGVYTLELLQAPRLIIFNGRAGNGTTPYTLTGPLSAGVFLGYLTSVYVGITQAFPVLFSSGETRTVNFTNSSAEIYWTTALTQPANANIIINEPTVTSLINGSAYLQSSWSLQPLTTSSVIESTQAPYLPYPLKGTPYYLQGCSWMTIDTTSLANTKTGASGQYLVYATDSSGNALVSLQLTPPKDGSNNLQITSVVSSGWSVYGEFIIM